MYLPSDFIHASKSCFSTVNTSISPAQSDGDKKCGSGSGNDGGSEGNILVTSYIPKFEAHSLSLLYYWFSE